MIAVVAVASCGNEALIFGFRLSVFEVGDQPRECSIAV